MVSVRVKGLKKATSKGRVYYYHRKTGLRIKSAPGTPAFFAEIAAAEATLERAPEAIPGTLGAVMDAYRNSSFYTDRREATRLSYDRAMELLLPMRNMPLVRITAGFAAQLRDKLAKKRGRWIVNYTITVLSILLDFAVERDWIVGNPIGKVRRLGRGPDDPTLNRPWKPEECMAVLEAAAPYLRVPIGLAMFCGFRKRDALTVTKKAIRDGLIEVKTSKRGKTVRVPIHPELAKILAGAPSHDAATIAATSKGLPFTSDGYNTVFLRLIAKLEAAGAVEEGLTTHGLRHTLATRLKEAGADTGDIADILGHSSLAMTRHYSSDADTTEKGREIIEAADIFGNKKRQGKK